MRDQETMNQKKATIKEIKNQLSKEETLSEEYLAHLRQDPRKGVQQALKSWDLKQAKKKALVEQFIRMQEYEKKARQNGYTTIAGIDEVGRGPLAGPVVSAAVILPETTQLIGLNDSKQLSLKERIYWAEQIKEQAVALAVSVVSASDIDRLNIYEATRVSMKTAVEDLEIKPDYLLIDAMTIDSPIPQERLIKGDTKSLSIAAASIIAKVTRDKLMEEYAVTYPHYGFERNAGYGTKDHLDGLKQFGATPIHRQSFRPVKDVLTQ